MIQEFYYGSSWHWPLEYIPRVMLSYNFIRTLKKPWKIDTPFMLDSGAYSVILKYGRYPYTARDYALGTLLWNPDIAWTMDFPCESSVRAKGQYTPTQAQILTIDKHTELENEFENLLSGPQYEYLEVKIEPRHRYGMVVQGWDLDDYLRNIDVIREHGLLTERLGIGSVCRRGKTQEVSRIIREIQRNVPGWVKLHGFGIKTDVLSTDARYSLYSADSMSWAYSWYGWTRNERTKEKKINGLRRYIDAIEPLLRAPEITLNNFVEASQ